jgi:hypothetical protein
LTPLAMRLRASSANLTSLAAIFEFLVLRN